MKIDKFKSSFGTTFTTKLFQKDKKLKAKDIIKRFFNLKEVEQEIPKFKEILFKQKKFKKTKDLFERKYKKYINKHNTAQNSSAQHANSHQTNQQKSNANTVPTTAPHPVYKSTNAPQMPHARPSVIPSPVPLPRQFPTTSSYSTTQTRHQPQAPNARPSAIPPSTPVTSQSTYKPQKVNPESTRRSEDNNFALPAGTIAKIQSVMGDVLKKNGNPALKLHYSQNVNRVFEHNEIPGFVFKTTVRAEESKELHNRIKNMGLAREIIKTHNLGLLVIPKAQVFQISYENRHYTMVAEEKLNISPNQGVQEREFEKHQDKLDKAIQQLSLFICKSGYDDVEFRNNPVIQNETDNAENRKLGLIDLETTRGAECGLNNLIRLASNTRQIELIKEVAKTHLPNVRLEDAVTQRVQQLEENAKIDKFHRQKGIVDGAAPLSVDSNGLGLDINKEERDEDGVIVNMGSVIQEFVNAINKQLAQSDPESSLRKRRCIYMRLSRIPTLAKCLEVGLPKGMLMDTSEADAHMWIPRIIKSLIQHNHIFKAKKVAYDQYLLQA